MRCLKDMLVSSPASPVLSCQTKFASATLVDSFTSPSDRMHHKQYTPIAETCINQYESPSRRCISSSREEHVETPYMWQLTACFMCYVLGQESPRRRCALCNRVQVAVLAAANYHKIVGEILMWHNNPSRGPEDAVSQATSLATKKGPMSL